MRLSYLLPLVYLCIVLGVVFIFGIVAYAGYLDIQEKDEICQSLGFGFSASNDNCGVRVGYDRTTAKNIYCYMPMSENKTAIEWCEDIQK